MSDFKKWFKGYHSNNEAYAEMIAKDAFEAGQQSKEAAIQEMDEVIKMQDADLRKCEKRIDAVRAIMNEYYTGSFDESPELAGLISAALEGDHAT